MNDTCPDPRPNRADSVMEMIAEIERLREALEFYAAEEECPLVQWAEKGLGSRTCLSDYGERARAALKDTPS